MEKQNDGNAPPYEEETGGKRGDRIGRWFGWGLILACLIGMVSILLAK